MAQSFSYRDGNFGSLSNCCRHLFSSWGFNQPMSGFEPNGGALLPKEDGASTNFLAIFTKDGEILAAETVPFRVFGLAEYKDDGLVMWGDDWNQNLLIALYRESKIWEVSLGLASEITIRKVVTEENGLIHIIGEQRRDHDFDFTDSTDLVVGPSDGKSVVFWLTL